MQRQYVVKLTSEQKDAFIEFADQVGRQVGKLVVNIIGFTIMFEIVGQIQKQDKISQ